MGRLTPRWADLPSVPGAGAGSSRDSGRDACATAPKWFDFLSLSFVFIDIPGLFLRFPSASAATQPQLPSPLAPGRGKMGKRREREREKRPLAYVRLLLPSRRSPAGGQPVPPRTPNRPRPFRILAYTERFVKRKMHVPNGAERGRPPGRGTNQLTHRIKRAAQSWGGSVWRGAREGSWMQVRRAGRALRHPRRWRGRWR